MTDQLFASIVTIATAIVGVAILAVLVSNRAQTSQVIQAATGGFAQDIAAAVSPVTGSNAGASSMNGMGMNGLMNFAGGGVTGINNY